MNERILMKLAEAEKKRRLTEGQRAMLGGAIGAASGVSLGGVLFNSPATRKQVAAAAAAGALYGLGETALRERLRRQATSTALQKEAAYGDQEKTASYYAVREMLGLDKEASQAPDRIQQEISKIRRRQALEDAILGNPRVKFRDLPPLQQAGAMAGGYYGAKKLRALRRGNTWSPAVDAILGAGIGASVGNLLGAIATDATIRHEERASQKRK